MKWQVRKHGRYWAVIRPSGHYWCQYNSWAVALRVANKLASGGTRD